MKVPKLVRPLCKNSERVFKECDDNEEAPNGRKMGAKRLRIDINPVLDFGGECADLGYRVVLERRRRVGIGTSARRIVGRGVALGYTVYVDSTGHDGREDVAVWINGPGQVKQPS